MRLKNNNGPSSSCVFIDLSLSPYLCVQSIIISLKRRRKGEFSNRIIEKKLMGSFFFFFFRLFFQIPRALSPPQNFLLNEKVSKPFFFLSLSSCSALLKADLGDADQLSLMIPSCKAAASSAASSSSLPPLLR
jgi:hypothetical protein